MKKNLVSFAVATMVLAGVTANAATPVDIHGDVQLHYRVNNDDALIYPWNWSNGAIPSDRHYWDIPQHTSSLKYTVHLNATTKLSDDVSAYARVAAQAYDGDNNSADYFVPSYGKSMAALDRFGIIFKDKYDIKYNIGRQAPGIGATKLILSDWSVGNYMHAVDGISMSGTTGVTSYQVMAGDLNFMNYSNEKTGYNKVYSAHVSYDPAPSLTVGATAARFVPSKAYTNEPFDTAALAGQDMNFYGVNASYNIGKLNLTTEYFKSTADQYNRAYLVRANYTLDPKNSVAVTYGDVDQHAYILCDIDGGAKGMYYAYNRDLGKGMWLNLNYNDMKWGDGNNAAGKKYNSLRLTVGYGF